LSATSRRWYPVLALAALAACLSCAALPAPAQIVTIRGAWMRPPEPVRSVGVQLDMMKRAGFNAIFLRVFYNGQTIFPSRVFPQHVAHHDTDAARIVLDAAHARGMRVYAAIDTLYWQAPGARSPAVEAHPEWVELNAEGVRVGDDGTPGGAFVSPAVAQVWSALEQLVGEIGRNYDFDGIAFDYARFATGDFLGYNLTDRKAYLLKHRVDPIDIDPLGLATSKRDRETMATWQEQQITDLVAALASTFRRLRPEGVVAAVVVPDYYANRLNNPVRQDWRAWVQRGLVQVVIAGGTAYTGPEAAQRVRPVVGLRSAITAAGIVPDQDVTGLDVVNQIEMARQAGLLSYVVWMPASRGPWRAVLRALGGFG